MTGTERIKEEIEKEVKEQTLAKPIFANVIRTDAILEVLLDIREILNKSNHP